MEGNCDAANGDVFPSLTFAPPVAAKSVRLAIWPVSPV
jgi:hypothetical protein